MSIKTFLIAGVVVLTLISAGGARAQSWCFDFNNYLYLGVTDADVNGGVTQLQTALTKEGFNVSRDPAGVFGNFTASAVIQFQAKYKISQTGTVGPKTRVQLNSLYGCSNTTNRSDAAAQLYNFQQDSNNYYATSGQAYSNFCANENGTIKPAINSDGYSFSCLDDTNYSSVCTSNSWASLVSNMHDATDSFCTDANGGIYTNFDLPTMTSYVNQNCACGITPNGQHPIPVTGLTVSPKTFNLAIGGTSQWISATLVPSDATDQLVTWASNNPDVKVDANGFVSLAPTATANETATITATADDKTKGTFLDTATVTVTAPVAVTGISLYPTALTVAVGKTAMIFPTISPANATNQNISSWSSDAINIATVDKNGKVTAVAIGTANITATTADGIFTATTAVTVAPAVSVTGISIDQPSLALTAVGVPIQLKAIITPLNATNTAIVWASDNPGVAFVNNKGIVIPLAAGTVNITVTTSDGGFTATSKITVANGLYGAGTGNGSSNSNQTRPIPSTNTLTISAGSTKIITVTGTAPFTWKAINLADGNPSTILTLTPSAGGTSVTVSTSSSVAANAAIIVSDKNASTLILVNILGASMIIPGGGGGSSGSTGNSDSALQQLASSVYAEALSYKSSNNNSYSGLNTDTVIANLRNQIRDTVGYTSASCPNVPNAWCNTKITDASLTVGPYQGICDKDHFLFFITGLSDGSNECVGSSGAIKVASNINLGNALAVPSCSCDLTPSTVTPQNPNPPPVVPQLLTLNSLSSSTVDVAALASNPWGIKVTGTGIDSSTVGTINGIQVPTTYISSTEFSINITSQTMPQGTIFPATLNIGAVKNATFSTTNLPFIVTNSFTSPVNPNPPANPPSQPSTLASTIIDAMSGFQAAAATNQTRPCLPLMQIVSNSIGAIPGMQASYVTCQGPGTNPNCASGSYIVSVDTHTTNSSSQEIYVCADKNGAVQTTTQPVMSTCACPAATAINYKQTTLAAIASAIKLLMQEIQKLLGR